MENRLSDVHTIAGELMRRGDIGQDNAAAEGSRIVRVERQPVSRGPAGMPAAIPFGLDEEMRKLNLQMEAIRRSVEFTEAHMAVHRNGANMTDQMPEAETSVKQGWSLPASIVANLILFGLLAAEIYDGRVGATAFALYRATSSMLNG